MNKRGMSAVIVSLIMVLLVLVATGVVWVVIRNIISEGAEQVSLDQFMVDLEIKSVKVVSDSQIEVKVSRNPGGGELEKINFVVSDGVSSETFEETTTLGELGEETFPLAYSGLVKKVSIAPQIKGSSGETKTGGVVNEFEVEEEDILTNLGAVSWWKLDGNADDEIGGNHGTEFGGVSYVDGKFGKAGDFDGNDDYINCGHDESLNLPGGFTYSIWAKRISGNALMGSYAGNYIGPQFYTVSGTPYFVIGEGGSINQDIYGGINLPNEWTFLVGTYDGTTMKFYINGEEVGYPRTCNAISWTGQDLTIARYSWTNSYIYEGSIDNPIIFNRALTEDEVKGLYHLDLS